MAASVVRSRQRNSESGVTIAIVALTLVALLGMAALAIDLVNLYVARGETQRAADAAALVGAKALVDYGVTSGDTSLQAAAQTYATAMATAAARQNLIVGQAGGVAVTYPNSGNATAFSVNPQIQVTVTRSGLPSFFAKVWAAGSNTTVANARAEAYNPSNATAVTGGLTLPVAARCVKPWLIENRDPYHGGDPFFNTTTGAITWPGLAPGGVIGEDVRMLSACGNNCTFNPPPPPRGPTGAYYYPLDLGSDTYENNVEGCNARFVACGDRLNLDTADVSVEPNPNRDAVETLIHARNTNYNQGQDELNLATSPFQILAQDNNPLVTGGIVADGAVVSTSASVVTVPVYDSSIGAPTNPATVIGFVQGFVTDVSGPPRAGRPDLVILNVAGCGGASGTPIAGGGGTPVPVRLIR